MLRWAIAMDIWLTTARPEYFFTNPRVSRRVESTKIPPRFYNLDKASGIITTPKTAASHLFGFFGLLPSKNTSVLLPVYIKAGSKKLINLLALWMAFCY
jgi:hypothetical protein